MVKLYAIHVDNKEGATGFIARDVELRDGEDIRIEIVPDAVFVPRDIYMCFTKAKANIVKEKIESHVSSIYGDGCAEFCIKCVPVSPTDARMIANIQFNV